MYIPMPEGLEGAGQGKYLLCLRNLFGLPEAPCDLYMANVNFMTAYGLEQSIFDPCVYLRSASKASEWPIIFVVLWVDDFAIVAPSKWADEFVKNYKKVFDMDDLGLIARWMGMECTWQSEGMYMSHVGHTYAKPRYWCIAHSSPATGTCKYLCRTNA